MKNKIYNQVTNNWSRYNLSISVLSFILLFVVVMKVYSQIDKLYMEGNKAYLSNNYEKAAGLYSQIITANPTYRDVYYKRGMCYLLTGQLDVAEDDFTRAIEYNTKNYDAYNARGLVYENMGETEKALSDYSNAIKYNSKFAEAYINRGSIYSRLSDFEGAINDLNKAINLDKNNPAAYFRRGKAHYKMKWFDKALNDYNTAIAKGMKNAEIYYDRGNVNFRKKDYKNSIKDYTEAIKYDKKYLDAYNNRALAYDEIGDKKSAEKDRDELSNITGVKFTPKDKLKYTTYKTKNGEISVKLPEGWFAFESREGDDLKFNISMKNDRNLNPGVGNVIMVLSKNMNKRYGESDPQRILGFWKGSMEKNSMDYERYDILTSKAFTHHGKFAQLNETIVQINAQSTLMYNYELGIADNDKFLYAYFQCPNRQVDYFQDIFYKATQSVVVKF